MSSSDTSLPPTLQSTLHPFTASDALPSEPTHPFSNAEKPWSTLNDIFAATSRISESLNAYLSFPLENTKLTSLLRQHTTASHSLNLAEQNARETVQALRTEISVRYSADVPMDQVDVVDWCVSQLEECGKKAGMETFKEAGTNGKITLILGGKVLVVDIELAVDRSDEERPKLSVIALKTSYASPVSGATTEGSVSMNGFLMDYITEFIVEAHKLLGDQDTKKAGKLIRGFLAHMQYLMKLDGMATQEGDGGLRWFNNIDVLALTAEGRAKAEAQNIARALSVPKTPLDIYLLKSQPLPLPYLSSPSLHFLVFLSPLAYLALLRRSTTQSAPTPSHLPNFDVPIEVLRAGIRSRPPPRGVTSVTLRVQDVSKPRSDMDDTMMSDFMGPLDMDMEFEHDYPQVPTTTALSVPTKPVWVLDFTNNGCSNGIAMGQSRMREIETIIHPFGHGGVSSHMGIIGPTGFASPSWVDLALNPDSPVTPERYTSIYVSPSSTHPRLNLRLTSPAEPGFFLQRVQVKSIKETWRVLEIVKKQCWLNEILRGHTWGPESSGSSSSKELAVSSNEDQASKADLQAVLTGSYQPTQIPVNVYFPPENTSNSESLFEPAATNSPCIKMTIPERPPISGLVEISVRMDLTKPKGVSVDVSGAFSADLNMEVLEEVCRRGGTLSLPGRVWNGTRLS
ncbi:hypothetical protein BDM02DRAFT_3094462 [Thelephora ganbajun]|uniref:Uncharacterized protein n=1 Tax=Thelephora ganbajun TaxID=370292 RepID=A0ACB6ZJE3_THEGA|nr:hypothetical protein BDM02DRAFT_3094462 [Thelephora ganbajun]